MFRRILLAALAASSLASAADAPLEIRFFPAVARPYALASERSLWSLDIQNIAIVNRGAQRVTVTGVELELMSGSEAIETRRLTTEDLGRAAAGGSRLQESGMLDAIGFLTGGVIPKGAKLPAVTSLEPSEALWLSSQVFAYRGKRDQVRVRVKGRASGSGVEATALLPIGGESINAYRFPLAGSWYVGAGPSFHSHHRWVPAQEFAFDLLKVSGDGKSHRGAGTARGEYFAYGETISAAAPGKVVAVVADEAETDEDLARPGEAPDAYLARVQQTQMKRLARGAPGVVGNHVVIEHAQGEHSVYAHMQTGSLKVKVGDRVEAGQALGAVGTSGNSTEPHLHFHVCDAPDPLACAGIPVRFENLDIYNADFPRPPQTGDVVKGR
jgi:murein DD-endopeptidase MepM/ murein hydrolase activator NlpD